MILNAPLLTCKKKNMTNELSIYHGIHGVVVLILAKINVRAFQESNKIN